MKDVQSDSDLSQHKYMYHINRAVIMLCRWDDMVGHSQLDSDMLEASPTPASTADDSVVQHAHAHAAPAEAMASDDDSDAGKEEGIDGADQAVQGRLSSPEAPQAALQGSPMHVPRPGRKRKRSGSRRGSHQEAASVSPCLCKLLSSLTALLWVHSVASNQLRDCSDRLRDCSDQLKDCSDELRGGFNQPQRCSDQLRPCANQPRASSARPRRHNTPTSPPLPAKESWVLFAQQSATL